MCKLERLIQRKGLVGAKMFSLGDSERRLPGAARDPCSPKLAGQALALGNFEAIWRSNRALMNWVSIMWPLPVSWKPGARWAELLISSLFSAGFGAHQGVGCASELSPWLLPNPSGVRVFDTDSPVFGEFFFQMVLFFWMYFLLSCIEGISLLTSLWSKRPLPFKGKTAAFLTNKVYIACHLLHPPEKKPQSLNQ